MGNITIIADWRIGGKRGIDTAGNGVTTITSEFATANDNVPPRLGRSGRRRGGAARFAVSGSRLGRDSRYAEGGIDLAFGQRLTIGASGFGSTSCAPGDHGARVSASGTF